MHRDIIRYLTLLVIVRLLVGAAFPAPNPWRRYRPGAFPGRTAHSTSPDDRLMRDVTGRPLPRLRAPDRPETPSCDVTPGRHQLSRPRVKAGAGSAPASDARSAAAERGGGSSGDGAAPSGVRAGGRSGSRRGTHRGRRSYDRKRGPRRHRRSWTTTGEGLLKISGINIQSLKPKTVDLYQELTRFDYDFVVLSETWLKPSIPNRLLVFPGYAVKRADRSFKPNGHSGVAIVFRDSYVYKLIIILRSPLHTTQPANLNLCGQCSLGIRHGYDSIFFYSNELSLRKF